VRARAQGVTYIRKYGSILCVRFSIYAGRLRLDPGRNQPSDEGMNNGCLARPIRHELVSPPAPPPQGSPLPLQGDVYPSSPATPPLPRPRAGRFYANIPAPHLAATSSRSSVPCASIKVLFYVPSRRQRIRRSSAAGLTAAASADFRNFVREASPFWNSRFALPSSASAKSRGASRGGDERVSVRETNDSRR